MTKYVSERHFNLNFLGKNWKDCHIVFREPTVKEMREMLNRKLSRKDPSEIIDITISMLKDNFIRGVAPGEKGELEKLTKEDLEELPSRFVEKAIVFLVGSSEEKAD
jgi:hypothetical protein